MRQIPTATILLIGTALLTVTAVPVAAVHGGADCGSTTGLPQCVAHDVIWCVDQTSQIVEDTLGEEAGEAYREVKCKLHTRPPFVIEGEPTAAQKRLYGIDGDGTRSDPYVIDNLEIAGSASGVETFRNVRSHGLVIRDSDAHYRVRKNYLHGWDCADNACPLDGAILLENAPHAHAWRNLLLENRVGVEVIGGSGDTHVAQNVIGDDDQVGESGGTIVGVRVRRGDWTWVSRNDIAARTGLYVQNGNNVALVDNVVDFASSGVTVQDATQASVHGNRLRTDDPTNTRGVTANAKEAQLSVRSNDITGPETGIDLSRTVLGDKTDATVNSNDIACAQVCIDVFWYDHVEIWWNDIDCATHDAQVGVRLSDVDDPDLQFNSFTGCPQNTD